MPTEWAAFSTLASASIVEALERSGILCTTIIDFIHSGVRIAWTAAKAARSCRARRDRCASTKPKPTPVISVSAVATFAIVATSICL
jgi:hypothetical protein